MADTRTISQLDAEGYPWIRRECCEHTGVDAVPVDPRDGAALGKQDKRPKPGGGVYEIGQVR